MKYLKRLLPNWLLEMSREMHRQDNRMTADPMFEVRHKKNLVTESDYNESHFEIIDEDGSSRYHSEISESYSELAKYLFDYKNEWCYSFLEDKREVFIDDDTRYSESEFIEFFNDNFEHEWDDLPEGIKKLSMQEVEVTVNSHFTEKSAQDFIDRKQHDYPKLYIYATSLCFCRDMKMLRNWILSLTDDEFTEE